MRATWFMGSTIEYWAAVFYNFPLVQTLGYTSEASTINDQTKNMKSMESRRVPLQNYYIFLYN